MFVREHKEALLLVIAAALKASTSLHQHLARCSTPHFAGVGDLDCAGGSEDVSLLHHNNRPLPGKNTLLFSSGTY